MVTPCTPGMDQGKSRSMEYQVIIDMYVSECDTVVINTVEWSEV